MDTIFINLLLLILINQIDLRRKERCVALTNLSMYYKWNKIYKKVIKSNKFKMSASTWNDRFKLIDESYSI